MGLTADLIEQAVAPAFSDLPEAAVETVRNAILDDVGISLLGYSTQGAPVVAWARDAGSGNREAVLFGDGTLVSCGIAAGANAQLAAETNLQEAGPGQHILSALAQTALAVGQRTGASGKDVIAAVTVGYQISGQLHAGLTDAAADAGAGMRHVPLTIALTAGRLLGLDAEQLNRAVSMCLYTIPMPATEGPFWQQWWKRRAMFHIGTCSTAINAALLALNGFEGPTDLLDFDTRYDADRAVVSPEPFYYPMRKLQTKEWQTSRGVHPGTQAMLELVEEHGIDVDDIERVTFRGPRLYMRYPFDDPAPTEFWAGVHSVPWALAMALLGYEPGRGWYTAERFADPRCRTLAARVVLEPGEFVEAHEIEKVPTATKQALADTANEIEILLRDGTRHTRRKSKNTALGSPGVPLSPEQLARKFTRFAAPVLGDGRAADLLGRLARLEDERDVRDLAPLLAAPQR